MPVDYPTVKIGDVARSVSNTHKGKDSLIFLNTSDILRGEILHRNYSSVESLPGQAKKSVCKDDILFSEIRPANGRWAYIEHDADDLVVSTKLMVIRAKVDKVLPRFLYQVLTSQEITRLLQQIAEARSGTFPQITFDQVSNLSFPLPSLAEQKSIAQIIGAIDEKIKINFQMRETLETIARSLFQSWFIDFDPVTRNSKGERSRPEDAQFPDSFEDSEVGAIPAGWRPSTLGGVSNNVSKTFDFKRTPEVIFVNTGDVLEGDFLHSTRTSHIGLPGQAKKSIRPDDILFSEIRPANKRYAYVDFDSSDYVVSTKFMIIRASEEIHPRLLYRILTSDETLAEFQLQAESRSGTFPQITFDSISHLPIVLPPMEIQEAFQRAVGSIDARIKLNKEESKILANLRDTLLPKLLSGDVKIQPRTI
jgi:type I restriction enzyme S subunit